MAFSRDRPFEPCDFRDGTPDRAGAARAMKAMLGMRKLDIAALQRAFDGR